MAYFCAGPANALQRPNDQLHNLGNNVNSPAFNITRNLAAATTDFRITSRDRSQVSQEGEVWKAGAVWLK